MLPEKVHLHPKLQLCCRQPHDLCQYLLRWAQFARKFVSVNVTRTLSSTLLCQECRHMAAQEYAQTRRTCYDAKPLLRIVKDSVQYV